MIRSGEGISYRKRKRIERLMRLKRSLKRLRGYSMMMGKEETTKEISLTAALGDVECRVSKIALCSCVLSGGEAADGSTIQEKT